MYRCTEKSTGLKLAAKFIGISKRQDRRNAEREVEIMRELQHPRLIQMYDAYEMNNIMCVVLELWVHLLCVGMFTSCVTSLQAVMNPSSKIGKQ